MSNFLNIAHGISNDLNRMADARAKDQYLLDQRDRQIELDTFSLDLEDRVREFQTKAQYLNPEDFQAQFAPENEKNALRSWQDDLRASLPQDDRLYREKSLMLERAFQPVEDWVSTAYTGSRDQVAQTNIRQNTQRILAQQGPEAMQTYLADQVRSKAITYEASQRIMADFLPTYQRDALVQYVAQTGNLGVLQGQVADGDTQALAMANVAAGMSQEERAGVAQAYEAYTLDQQKTQVAQQEAAWNSWAMDWKYLAGRVSEGAMPLSAAVARYQEGIKAGVFSTKQQIDEVETDLASLRREQEARIKAATDDRARAALDQATANSKTFLDTIYAASKNGANTYSQLEAIFATYRPMMTTADALKAEDYIKNRNQVGDADPNIAPALAALTARAKTLYKSESNKPQAAAEEAAAHLEYMTIIERMKAQKRTLTPSDYNQALAQVQALMEYRSDPSRVTRAVNDLSRGVANRNMTGATINLPGQDQYERLAPELKAAGMQTQNPEIMRLQTQAHTTQKQAVALQFTRPGVSRYFNAQMLSGPPMFDSVIEKDYDPIFAVKPSMYTGFEDTDGVVAVKVIGNKVMAYHSRERKWYPIDQVPLKAPAAQPFNAWRQ